MFPPSWPCQAYRFCAWLCRVRDSVLIEEVSFIQSFLYREVSLYVYRVMFPELLNIAHLGTAITDYRILLPTRIPGVVVVA